MIYLTNTFSPLMLEKGARAEVAEMRLDQISVPFKEMSHAISHETTSKVFSTLLGEEINFNRVNLCLKSGDQVYCIIPSFRANEAREFTKEEIESSPIRVFYVYIF